MNYYEEIKQELVNNEITKKVKDYSKNKSDLQTYYNVGKLLSEAGKHYGEGIIKKYSIKLTNELGKGYSISSLKRMRKFYFMIQKGAAMTHQLSWSHYMKLLPIDDINIINFYINLAVSENLTYRQLGEKIKNREYERLPEETKNKLVNKGNIGLPDMVKNPILIKNKYDTDKISEKMLQMLILENIEDFLKELGDGFSYIDKEYKIKISDRYNYIDILLFNYIYNAFVVIELKVTELKAEHIGQIKKYMNYVDKNIKSINQDKTIGIIIVKRENKFLIEYVSDERILQRKYELT